MSYTAQLHKEDTLTRISIRDGDETVVNFKVDSKDHLLAQFIYQAVNTAAMLGVLSPSQRKS